MRVILTIARRIACGPASRSELRTDQALVRFSRVYQVNGGSDLVGDHVVGRRPGNVIANAFRAGFHLVAHRALPSPVGSSDRVVR
jgi:hypothetical protein